MDMFVDLHRKILEFRESRDWKKFHTPENLAKSIVIEAAELLENFQWGDEYNSNDVIDELADIMIYSVLLADSLDVDLIKIMGDKIKKNEKRFPVERVKGNSGKKTRVEIDD